MKRNGRSIGELISSITFFVGAVWLGLEANSFFDKNDFLRAIPVSVGAVLSFWPQCDLFYRIWLKKLDPQNGENSLFKVYFLFCYS